MPTEKLQPISEEQYKAMTKQQRAVAVAKDVLAQLSRRSCPLNAKSGSYINLEEGHNLTPDIISGDLQKHVDKVQKNCHVCARGALLLSKARVMDHVPMGEVIAVSNWDKTIYAGVTQDTTFELMRDVFTRKELDTIEAAFEITSEHLTTQMDKRTYGAIVFGAKYKDEKSRLRAIMQNIVANEGKFVVEPATRSQAAEHCYYCEV